MEDGVHTEAGLASLDARRLDIADDAAAERAWGAEKRAALVDVATPIHTSSGDVTAFDRRFAAWVFSLLGKPLAFLFRGSVTGLDNVDLERTGILASNHNAGGWGAIEVLITLAAWYRDPARPGLMLLGGTHMQKVPGVRRLARRAGIGVASVNGLDAALGSGRFTWIQPGGLTDQFRPFWERHRARWKRPVWVDGRRVLVDQLSYVAAAAERGCPIYPIAVSGTYGMSPVLWESTAILRWSGLGRLRRDEMWPSFPITLNHLVNLALFLLTPWASRPWAWILFVALNVYFDLAYMYPLFPFRVRVRFGAPVEVPRIAASASSRERTERYRAIHAEVVRRVESMLAKPAEHAQVEQPADDWRRRVFWLLTLYCGCFQVGHIVLNAASLWNQAFFPLPPSGGWHDQARLVFYGIGISDSLAALASLAFVAGVARGRAWARPVGFMSLSAFVFGNVNFLVLVFVTGSGGAALWLQVALIELLSAPLLVLFAWLFVDLLRREPLETGA